MTTAFGSADDAVVVALLPLRRGVEKEADLREKDGLRSRVRGAGPRMVDTRGTLPGEALGTMIGAETD